MSMADFNSDMEEYVHRQTGEWLSWKEISAWLQRECDRRNVERKNLTIRHPVFLVVMKDIAAYATQSVGGVVVAI